MLVLFEVLKLDYSEAAEKGMAWLKGRFVNSALLIYSYAPSYTPFTLMTC